jgi:hypothetical protein
MMTRASVALIRTSPETVLQDYERLMELAGLRTHLDPSAITILKAVVSRLFPFPGANTTPWQLEGTIRALQRAGYRDLGSIQADVRQIDRFTDPDLNGYQPILCAAAVSTYRRRDLRWIHYKPRRPLLILDHLCDQGISVPEILLGANVVHLPTIRGDRTTRIAGAIRSAGDGLLSFCHQPATPLAPELLIDLLAVQQEILAGVFAVMDGTTAGDGPGPRRLRPEVKNALLASADPVALDAVAARLMGLDPLRDLGYVRLAHERGLGVGDVRAIALVGDVDLARENWRFSLGGGSTGIRHRLLRSWPLAAVACTDARMPLMRLLERARELYDGCYRWPARDRQVFEGWLRGTRWGQLFQRYQRLHLLSQRP